MASLLVGVLAGVAGLWAATRLRQDRCLDARGSWDATRRACAMPDGVASDSTLAALRDYGIGVLVALVVGFVLWRVYLAASGGRARARGR
jgi:hypothetical protein